MHGVECCALKGEELVDATLRQGKHFIELRTIEWARLGRTLDFDEFTGPGHSDVHIDFSPAIL